MISYSIKEDETGVAIAVKPLLLGSSLEGDKLKSRSLSELTEKLQLIDVTIERLQQYMVMDGGVDEVTLHSGGLSCQAQAVKVGELGYIAVRDWNQSLNRPEELSFVFLSPQEAQIHTHRMLSLIQDRSNTIN